MNRSALAFFLLLPGVLSLGCAPLPEPAEYDGHPEAPSILRDTAMIDDEVRFTSPFVPGHRTTMDGRVALRVQGGPPGPPHTHTSLSFFLFAPEALEEPILPGPAGAAILPEPDPWIVEFPPALEPEVGRLGHHAICDPTVEFPVEGERPNPYACGPDGLNDCYDITVISSTSVNLLTQLWGTPATVEVANPKTPEARIVDVTLGEPVAGTQISSTVEFTEPAVTMDGRLLTGRIGRFPRKWTHPETGEEFIRPYDLVYCQLPDDASPCDITAWTGFHPMSYAPYDPRMKGRYGIAAYPFRDTEGNPIEPGEDVGGTYPWVDREGANVFMTAVHGRIVEQSEERYPRRCVHEGCEQYSENVDWDRGFLVGGLWTHGKFVHLDGMINNIDWAVGVSPETHWLVDLYKDRAGEAVQVRFGSGRFVDAMRNAGGPYPDGYTHNANVMDSLQNLPNHQGAAKPVTPRDVVWVMSSGVATDEIAFDDFLDPDAFIVSNMQASITQLYDESGRSLAIPYHHNGQVRTLEGGVLIAADVKLHPEDDAPIHIQNAATGLHWTVPSFGFVQAGTARVEPVALGGVQGRGFWLSGTNEIRYAIPAQDREVRDVDWTVGIYVDPRYDDGEVHTLLRFPDESGVRLVGRDALQYVRGDRVIREVELPAWIAEPGARDGGWFHLGWRVTKRNKEVELLVDGYAWDRTSRLSPLFVMEEGALVVGQAGEQAWGFRGWIDDFVVLAHDVNPEVACNHARGTLVRVEDNEAWGGRAAAHPDWAHEAVAELTGNPEESRYICFADLSGDYLAHLANIPAGTTPMRERINFPEGPLRAGAPRPDSTENPFCLSCHTAEGKGGLSLEALAPRPGVNAELDERRQPMQPPRRVFGNIPGGWIPAGEGPGSPAEAMQAPAEGVVIDAWVLPGVE